jgi:hypothetical protein
MSAVEIRMIKQPSKQNQPLSTYSATCGAATKNAVLLTLTE